MSNKIGTEQCPACAQRGEDRTGDNLAVYDDGHKYCYKCKHREEGSPVDRSAALPKSGLTVSQIQEQPVKADPARKLSPQTVELYGVRGRNSSVTGKTENVYYPYHAIENEARGFGEVIGYKVRTLPKQFSFAGKAEGCFGRHLLHTHVEKKVIITEGEEDALAVYEQLAQQGKPYCVISLPNGANSVEKVLDDMPGIARHPGVILFLDNDDPGREAADRLAELLIGKIPTVQIVREYAGYKDASDMHVASDTLAMWQALKTAEEFKPEGVVAGSDFDVDAFFTEEVEHGYAVPYPYLEARLRGLRKGELVTVTAGSGIGKSTLCRELGYSLVRDHGLKVLHLGLEDSHGVAQLSYIALDNNVPWPRLRENRDLLTKEEVQRTKDTVFDNMFFWSHFGSVSADTLISAIEYYVQAHDVDFVVLDHLSIVVSGMDTGNERKSIDLIMTKLAELVVRTGVGILSVVHLKRPDGKDFNSGDSVSLGDLRGSAALEQLSWTVLSLERNQQAEDGAQDYALLRVLKNRTWGSTGVCDELRYDSETGRLLCKEQALELDVGWKQPEEDEEEECIRA